MYGYHIELLLYEGTLHTVLQECLLLLKSSFKKFISLDIAIRVRHITEMSLNLQEGIFCSHDLMICRAPPVMTCSCETNMKCIRDAIIYRYTAIL